MSLGGGAVSNPSLYAGRCMWSDRGETTPASMGVILSRRQTSAQHSTSGLQRLCAVEGLEENRESRLGRGQECHAEGIASGTSRMERRRLSTREGTASPGTNLPRPEQLSTLI